MTYDLPTDISERVQAHLESGAHRSEDDVLRAAMDALDQVELEKLTHWHERNQLASEQSAQGLSRPLDDQRVLARLRERLAKEGILD